MSWKITAQEKFAPARQDTRRAQGNVKIALSDVGIDNHTLSYGDRPKLRILKRLV